ncbi:MAG: ABC transporter permease [Candidatus Acidiferrales bacterium]
MFFRLLGKLLIANRGRLTVALVALVSGAAVASALLNLELDAESKLAREFRSLGANLIIAPSGATAAPGDIPAASTLFDETSVMRSVQASPPPGAVAAAPFLYIIARASGSAPVVVAGTWLDKSPSLAPWRKIEGSAISSREDHVHCLVGRNAARQLGLTVGAPLMLRYGAGKTQLTVAGIVDAGGTEDNQVFVNLAVAQELAGLSGKVELVELSVEASQDAIRGYQARLAAALPSLDVRPVRQIAEAEGALLLRIRSLILAMVVLILSLTALCVLATMAALAMERRADVGLMKALGGSTTRVFGVFLAEVGVLGAAGGVLGYFAGILLSAWMGRRVFDASISPRLEVLPLTVALMVSVAFAGALPLRWLGKVRPAVILRGEQ